MDISSQTVYCTVHYPVLEWYGTSQSDFAETFSASCTRKANRLWLLYEKELKLGAKICHNTQTESHESVELANGHHAERANQTEE